MRGYSERAQKHQTTRSPKQAKWVLCLHFRNKSAEGIELKNSAKESFRPIDRSLWSSVMLEALVASSATFHSTYFSLCQLLYARRPRRFNRSSWRSLYCACRHVSNLPQSPHKLPEAPAQALGLDNSWELCCEMGSRLWGVLGPAAGRIKTPASERFFLLIDPPSFVQIGPI